MPLTYYGDGSQPAPVTTTRINIASSTNATPIVVTTATNHGFSAAGGDTVEVEGHLVNTAANGVSQITWLSPTTFSLNGSVGNGVGGATGYVDDYEVSPAQTFPLDGENVDSSTSNPPLENLTNAVPFLYRRAGKYRLYDIYTGGAGTDGGSAWATGTLTTNSFVNLTTGTALLGFAGGAHSPVLQATDILLATITTSLLITFAGSTTISLAASIAGGTYISTVLCSEVWQPTAGDSGIGIIGASWSGIYAGGGTGVFDFGMVARLTPGSAGSSAVALEPPWRLIVQHYRQN